MEGTWKNDKYVSKNVDHNCPCGLSLTADKEASWSLSPGRTSKGKAGRAGKPGDRAKSEGTAKAKDGTGSVVDSSYDDNMDDDGIESIEKSIGVLRYASGDEYHGECVDGKRHGKGAFSRF